MLSADYKLNLPHIERIFEIHPLDFLLDPSTREDREYIPYLEREHPYPIYMMEKLERFPSSVKYPLDEICGSLLPTLRRESGEVIRYFTSTAAYMLAQAIYEDFRRIEIYGFEMGTDTEYKYQKASMEFWIGVATGRGIEVILPDRCKLMKAKMYAYEALHMITRTALEAVYKEYQKTRAHKEAEANAALGEWRQIDQRAKMGLNGDQAKAQEVWDRLELLRAEVHGNAGAMQAIAHLIKLCDMQVAEPEYQAGK